LQVARVNFIELSLLDALAVARRLVLSIRLAEHLGNLLSRHINSILDKKSSDLSDVERATAIGI